MVVVAGGGGLGPTAAAVAELGLDDVDAELVDAAEEGDVGAEVLQREVLDLLRHQSEAGENRELGIVGLH